MGRLEVCLGGTFGSVCDENWSTAGASVVCRQLGLSSQGGQGAGPLEGVMGGARPLEGVMGGARPLEGVMGGARPLEGVMGGARP